MKKIALEVLVKASELQLDCKSCSTLYFCVIFCNAYKGTEVRVIKYLQSAPNPQESCS